MHEDEFIETVRQEASLDSADAAREATDATLRTLGERISDGEVDDIADQLPEGIAAPLVEAGGGPAEPLSLEEFTRRVDDRADVDAEAVVATRAVATALDEATDELGPAREQLPTEFDVVTEPGGPVTDDEFLEAVRERADLDSQDAARTATVATLRTLGERLSAGEAADLALYVPDALGEELREAGDDSATDYSLEEFVRRLSQRESVDVETARTHAQAACSVLAEAAGERELDAAAGQLPDPYGTLFEPSDAANGDAAEE